MAKVANKPSSQSASQDELLVTVKVLSNVSHDGKHYAAGDLLVIAESALDPLLDCGVVDVVLDDADIGNAGEVRDAS